MDARETVSDEIDLYELLRKIAKYKWFILIFTLVSCITAYIVLSLLPPKYKVEMTVMPNNKEFMNIYLSQLKERAEFKLIHGEVDISIYTSSMVANLASRDVHRQALNKIAGKTLKNPDINIKPDKKISLAYNLTIEHEDRELAYKLAFAIVDEANERLLKQFEIKDKNVKLILITDPPQMPQFPRWPRMGMIIAVAFGGAIFGSIFIVLIYDWFITNRRKND